MWSSEILAELQEHEEMKLLGAVPGIDQAEAARRARHLVTTMQKAFRMPASVDGNLWTEPSVYPTPMTSMSWQPQ